MSFSEIKQLNWTKRIGLRFILLSCSYWGEQFYYDLKKAFAVQNDHILFINDNGVASLFSIKNEDDLLFQEILKLIDQSPQDIVGQWAIDLKKQSDRLNSIISEPVENFLDLSMYQKMERLFNDYLPLHIVTKYLPDYLSDVLFDKYFSLLKEARSYAEPTYTNVNIFFRNFTSLIALRVGYEPQSLQNILKTELINYLKKGKMIEEEMLKARSVLSALYFENGRQHLLLGNDVKNIVDVITHVHCQDKDSLHGQCAYKGKSRGICRIIHNPAEVKEFNEGDILVTGMTRPDFLPLIRLAAAVVVDGGGILSHAAIIARELKKPCLIGTEVATRFFKDGDMVEVDAGRGTVIKI